MKIKAEIRFRLERHERQMIQNACCLRGLVTHSSQIVGADWESTREVPAHWIPVLISYCDLLETELVEMSEWQDEKFDMGGMLSKPLEKFADDMRALRGSQATMVADVSAFLSEVLVRGLTALKAMQAAGVEVPA